jgi:hypothetical protein
MPRSKGSLNKKGKQSVEERKAKRREKSKPKTAESRSKEYAQLKLKRREKKIANLTTKIKEKREALLQLGRFANTSDPSYRKMQRLIQGEMEQKLEYIRGNSSIELANDADVAHVNRLLMFIFNCDMTHRAKGCKRKTLPAYIQKELQQCALDAETVTKTTLRQFFQRLFREEVFSPKKLSQAQDASMSSQISGGSIESLRSLESLSPREKGIFPSRSTLQRHNYAVEVGAETKYIEAEETEDGSIFRISPSSITRYSSTRKINACQTNI